jgi:hypothetical protein
MIGITIPEDPFADPIPPGIAVSHHLDPPKYGPIGMVYIWLIVVLP